MHEALPSATLFNFVRIKNWISAEWNTKNERWKGSCLKKKWEFVFDFLKKNYDFLFQGAVCGALMVFKAAGFSCRSKTIRAKGQNRTFTRCVVKFVNLYFVGWPEPFFVAEEGTTSSEKKVREVRWLKNKDGKCAVANNLLPLCNTGNFNRNRS